MVACGGLRLPHGDVPHVIGKALGADVGIAVADEGGDFAIAVAVEVIQPGLLAVVEGHELPVLIELELRSGQSVTRGGVLLLDHQGVAPEIDVVELCPQPLRVLQIGGEGGAPHGDLAAGSGGRLAQGGGVHHDPLGVVRAA